MYQKKLQNLYCPRLGRPSSKSTHGSGYGPLKSTPAWPKGKANNKLKIAILTITTLNYIIYTPLQTWTAVDPQINSWNVWKIHAMHAHTSTPPRPTPRNKLILPHSDWFPPILIFAYSDWPPGATVYKSRWDEAFMSYGKYSTQHFFSHLWEWDCLS